jgi:hypothetical protein
MAAEGIPVELACRVVDVSTSGYYGHQRFYQRLDRSARMARWM